MSRRITAIQPRKPGPRISQGRASAKAVH